MKSWKKSVLAPDLWGGGYPTFGTCVFKSHLRRSMWPVLVEFRSASAEGSGRKKRILDIREIDRIALKPKSTDKYVGRPNKTVI